MYLYSEKHTNVYIYSKFRFIYCVNWCLGKTVETVIVYCWFYFKIDSDIHMLLG